MSVSCSVGGDWVVGGVVVEVVEEEEGRGGAKEEAREQRPRVYWQIHSRVWVSIGLFFYNMVLMRIYF